MRYYLSSIIYCLLCTIYILSYLILEYMMRQDQKTTIKRDTTTTGHSVEDATPRQRQRHSNADTGHDNDNDTSHPHEARTLHMAFIDTRVRSIQTKTLTWTNVPSGVTH